MNFVGANMHRFCGDKQKYETVRDAHRSKEPININQRSSESCWTSRACAVVASLLNARNPLRDRLKQIAARVAA
jgi:hypothetical protein